MHRGRMTHLLMLVGLVSCAPEGSSGAEERSVRAVPGSPDAVLSPARFTGSETIAFERPGLPGIAAETGRAPAKLLRADEAIPDQYIVIFEETYRGQVDRLIGEIGQRFPMSILHVYRAAVPGFAADMSEAVAIELLDHPAVRFIEEDSLVEAIAVQSGATWGLDRIDARSGTDGDYAYNFDGTGVHAYIIDTGIRQGHNEFSGRIGNGYDSVGNDTNPEDCNGHGTHVAGTVGGTVYGVAKNVTLHGVRVLSCSGSGSNSGVIAGVDWVALNASFPAVGNMSLGGGISSALDSAVNGASAAGVVMVVAAGNSNTNACNASPARAADAITVGSTTNADQRSSFSNFGTCVDIFAPGSSITSAWYTSNSATRTISGTSMASPHVAGVAALYLEANPGASPSAVTSAVLSGATSGVVANRGSGSPNLLLYSLLGGGGGAPPPPPPAPCSGPSCEDYSGFLSGTNDWDAQPNGTYFFSSSGTHRGWLRGPSSGADFDLELRRWSGFSWRTVASSLSPTSVESVTYSGSSGYYYWRIESYSGSGSYDFWMTRP